MSVVGTMRFLFRRRSHIRCGNYAPPPIMRPVLPRGPRPRWVDRWALAAFFSINAQKLATPGDLDGVYRIWQKGTGRFLDAYEVESEGAFPWSVVTRLDQDTADYRQQTGVKRRGGFRSGRPERKELMC